jgi:hypothetical protein
MVVMASTASVIAVMIPVTSALVELIIIEVVAIRKITPVKIVKTVV